MRETAYRALDNN